MYPQTNLLINPNKKLDFNGVVTIMKVAILVIIINN
jgi:hypothetical protein